MWEITHLPHQGNKNVAQNVAVQNHKDFFGPAFETDNCSTRP